MAKHDALQSTRNDAVYWADKAKESLMQLPESDIRDTLMGLPDYVVSRAV